MKTVNKFLGVAAFLCATTCIATVGLTIVRNEQLINSQVDATPIGSQTPSSGAFTNLHGTGTFGIGAGLYNDFQLMFNNVPLRRGISIGPDPQGDVTVWVNHQQQNAGMYVHDSATGSVWGSILADGFHGAVIGNATTATALQSTPTNCGTFGYATGVSANGNALCGNVSGNSGANGFQTLPGGLIVQWVTGSQPVNGRGQLTVNLPTAFPNGCLSASVAVQFVNTVTGSNFQGANFYLQPNGCQASQVFLVYDVRPDGLATSSYVPVITAIGH